MGGVTLYELTQDLADTICSRLIEGESLRTICLTEGMPSASTICRWLGAEENDWFAKQYAHAREAQADTLADEILDISDDGSNDWMEKRNGEGDVVGQEYNGDAVQRSRLRVDSRKWYAGKLAPSRYGDRIQTDVTTNGKDLHASDHELAAKLAAILEAAAKRRDGG
jgi:hypothetical protein